MATSSFDKKFIVKNQESADKIFKLLESPAPSVEINREVTTADSRENYLEGLKSKWLK